jgi:hypothetical protein
MEKEEKLRPAFDMDIAGGDVLFLGWEGFFYFFCVFLVEFFKQKGTFNKVFNKE